jgi:hypothetical protein
MSEYQDPRKAGFNYGIGWGSDPKPMVYYQAQDLARRLGKEAEKASQAAWSVEMAVRDLRLAETSEEKHRAISNLENIVSRYDLTVAKA